MQQLGRRSFLKGLGAAALALAVPAAAARAAEALLEPERRYWVMPGIPPAELRRRQGLSDALQRAMDAIWERGARPDFHVVGPSYLERVDLSSSLSPVFEHDFPIFERLPKLPSPGIAHPWVEPTVRMASGPLRLDPVIRGGQIIEFSLVERPLPLREVAQHHRGRRRAV